MGLHRKPESKNADIFSLMLFCQMGRSLSQAFQAETLETESKNMKASGALLGQTQLCGDPHLKLICIHVP